MARLALQLYTLRDCYQSPEEFSNLLYNVKSLGFAGVELAGSGGLSAAQLKARLDELGLAAVCAAAWTVELAGGPALRPPRRVRPLTQNKVYLVVAVVAALFMVVRNLV